MPNVSSEAIRVRAFALWEADGRPDGRTLDYWLAAEQALSNEADAAPLGAADAEPETPPATVTGTSPTKAASHEKGKPAAKVAVQPAVPARTTRASKSRSPSTHATGR